MKYVPVTLMFVSWLACGPKEKLNETGETSTGQTSETSGLMTSSSSGASSTSSLPTSGVTTATSTDGTMDSALPFDVGGPQECNVWGPPCDINEKCMPFDVESDGIFEIDRCVPVADRASHIGEPCVVPNSFVDGLDTCDADSICWDLDNNGHGTCHAFCKGTSREAICPPASFCLASENEVLVYCEPFCNPTTPDCAQGFLCIPQFEMWLCVPPGRSKSFAEPCELDNDCEPGLLCLDAAGTVECVGDVRCCTPLCSISDPTCPGAEQTCHPWYDMPPPGFEDVGFCTAQ